jgi:hypothetical protein
MTMTISYTRTFNYQDKVDNVDIVSAGGDTGLNAQFHSIEAEFDTISSVVSQVNDQFGTQSTQLASLGQQVSALGNPVPRSVSLVPILTATNNTGWNIEGGGAIFGHLIGFAAGKTGGNASGVMSLTLPVGGQITAFRALGTNQGNGTLGLVLGSQGLTGQGAKVIATITVNGQATPAPPFDVTQNVLSPSVGGIAADTSYWIEAGFQSTGPNDSITLFGFQVLYLAS